MAPMIISDSDVGLGFWYSSSVLTWSLLLRSISMLPALGGEPHTGGDTDIGRLSAVTQLNDTRVAHRSRLTPSV